jgi:hypothetical protein
VSSKKRQSVDNLSLFIAQQLLNYEKNTTKQQDKSREERGGDFFHFCDCEFASSTKKALQNYKSN